MPPEARLSAPVFPVGMNAAGRRPSDRPSSAAVSTLHPPVHMWITGTKRRATIGHPNFSSCKQCHVPADGQQSTISS
jgi:hypothetical protein